MNFFLLLSTLFCWPVLLWQAKRVRKSTLRLPEASGVRDGGLGDGPPLRLLICGDSAAAGVGIAQQQQALSGQLVTQLAKHYQLHWVLHAKTGLDCQGLIAYLQHLPAQHFDLVVVSVGVNDVIGLTANRQFKKHIEQLVVVLQQRYKGADILFSAIPPMQHFSALPTPLNFWLGQKAAALNQYFAKALASKAGCYFLTSPIPLSASMLAIDGFHPSEHGCHLWAEALVNCHLNRVNESLAVHEP